MGNWTLIFVGSGLCGEHSDSERYSDSIEYQLKKFTERLEKANHSIRHVSITSGMGVMDIPECEDVPKDVYLIVMEGTGSHNEPANPDSVESVAVQFLNETDLIDLPITLAVMATNNRRVLRGVDN